MAMTSPDLMNDILIYDQNQYVPTRDGVTNANGDINMIFHKAAIKAGLRNGLIKNARSENSQ